MLHKRFCHGQAKSGEDMSWSSTFESTDQFTCAPGLLLCHFLFVMVQYLNQFPHCFIYIICTVHMHLITLLFVSIYLWHHSKCSCWPAQSHGKLWLKSMHLKFCIILLKERTSKFCIFTNCFKMAAVSCFMGLINIFVFQSNFWNSCILLQITFR